MVVTELIFWRNPKANRKIQLGFVIGTRLMLTSGLAYKSMSSLQLSIGTPLVCKRQWRLSHTAQTNSIKQVCWVLSYQCVTLSVTVGISQGLISPKWTFSVCQRFDGQLVCWCLSVWCELPIRKTTNVWFMWRQIDPAFWNAPPPSPQPQDNV